MKSLMSRGIAVILMVMVMAQTVYGVEKSVTPKDNDTGMYNIAGADSDIPALLAESAIVVDMKTGYTLIEKNIHQKLYPASITKIMTAILTLEQAAMNEVVTFSYDAVHSIEVGSSAAYVDVDEQLSVEQCLYGLMLISGNDLANGLAEHVGGSMESFAAMMTEKAKGLGCETTNFTNAHGLHDENHYTTAYDMALISKYAYDNLEMFRTLCSTGYYECQPTNKQEEIRYWRNNNKLINEYQEEYYEDCIGGKTGFTNQAGGTLVSFANVNGRVLMCVIMKSTHSLAAYADTTNLYEYVRNNVTAEMYADLDKKYEESKEVETEPATTVKPSEDNGDVTGTEKLSTESVEPVVSNDADEEESDGIWIGWFIILAVIVIFGIYYAYLQYVRYKIRKRRREERMRRRNS
ncbi:MAG: D-alanyl-D-alanine carboxypeptidase [Lachnospiraceae bacterium]|nr:D-alanyl-D-alanine carboxypeptidase [Lachnospiraceae bacterium]